MLVGSPHGEVRWERDVPALFGGDGGREVTIPWEGRTVVLRVTDDGRRWDLWTDWVGSIPVYFARLDQGWIASTLEPVVVAAAGFSCDALSLSALLVQLIEGHFPNDATLFTGMAVVPADCHATWHRDHVTHQRLWTVTPSCERWETGWDDLVDEMYQTIHESIRIALSQWPSWLIPLSSGLDSRLIAAVGAQLGVDLRAYTWGSRISTDVVQGRRVARQLGVPWQHVDLGTEYLLTETRPWTDVFGSSMHVHGMYQMAFFRQLRRLPPWPVVSGYLGDTLCDNGNDGKVTLHADGSTHQLLDDRYLHWEPDEVAGLLKVPTGGAMAAIREEIAGTLARLPGALFQRTILLELWNRQRRFTGFNAWVADYERGVATPYLSRAYARFCLSIPRAASSRRLLADVFRRYFPALAAIPGSYAPEPYLLTGRYLLKRRLAKRLPFAFTRGGVEDVPLTMDLDCVRAHGWRALWPIREAWERLGRWVDLEQVSSVVDAIAGGSDDVRLVKRLQSIQCLAYRLHDDPTHPDNTE